MDETVIPVKVTASEYPNELANPDVQSYLATPEVPSHLQTSEAQSQLPTSKYSTYLSTSEVHLSSPNVSVIVSTTEVPADVSTPEVSTELLTPEVVTPPRFSREKIKSDLIKIARKLVVLAFSYVGLTCMVVCYSLLGAVIFQALESWNEEAVVMQIAQERQTRLRELWEITKELNILSKDDWIRQATGVIKEFEHRIYIATSELGWDGHTNEVIGELNWSFTGSLLYSVTVITTIGYGHITPKTWAGRIITIIYALIGIPLTLLCLANVGKIWGKCFKLLYSKIQPSKKRTLTYTYTKQEYTNNEGYSDVSGGEYSGNKENDELTTHQHSSHGGKRDVMGQEHLRHSGKCDVMGHKHLSHGEKCDVMGQEHLRHSGKCDVMGHRHLSHSGNCDIMGQEHLRHSGKCDVTGQEHLRHSGKCDVMGQEHLRHSGKCDVMGHEHLHHSGKCGVMGNKHMSHDGKCDVMGHKHLHHSGKCDITVDVINREHSSITNDVQERHEDKNKIKGKEEINNVQVPIIVCILLVVVYILIGVLIFTFWERKWNVLTSAYFCFITLSTIGFGDFVPGHSTESWSNQPKQVICTLYLLFGLALLAMCFDLIQDQVRTLAKKVGVFVKLLKQDTE